MPLQPALSASPGLTPPSAPDSAIDFASPCTPLEPAHSHPPSKAPKDIHVLIVDDNDINLKVRGESCQMFLHGMTNFGS